MWCWVLRALQKEVWSSVNFYEEEVPLMRLQWRSLWLLHHFQWLSHAWSKHSSPGPTCMILGALCLWLVGKRSQKEYRKYEKTWEQEERVFMNPMSDWHDKDSSAEEELSQKALLLLKFWHLILKRHGWAFIFRKQQQLLNCSPYIEEIWSIGFWGS